MRALLAWFRDHWVNPITRQWPFMVAYIVLIGWESVTKNPIPRWMIIFMHAYLAAVIIDLLRWRIVKWLAYLIVYTLFLTELVLSWNYGMHLSPIIFTLLVETNNRESIDFLQSLLDQPDFAVMVLCIVTLLIGNIILEVAHLRINRLITNRKAINGMKSVAGVMIVAGLVFNTISNINLFRCQEMNNVDEWRSHMRYPDDAVTKVE